MTARPHRRPERGLARAAWLAAAALAAAALAATAAGPARAEVIERVVAIVNDDAIFLSELRRRAAPFLPSLVQSVGELERPAALQQLYGELLDRLVEERLVEQTASRLQLRVTRADVDAAVGNVAEANGLTMEQFWDAVRGQGFSEAQYRSDVRRQLLRLKVINQRARDRVNITEEDVRRRYEREARAASRELRFRLAEIFFPVAATASATDAASIRAEAADLRATLDADNFFDWGGVDLGVLGQGDLPAALEDAVSGVEPGTVVGPVRGPNGFHLLLLVDRETAAAEARSFEERREELHRVMLEEAIERQSTQILEELRREAVVEQRL